MDAADKVERLLEIRLDGVGLQFGRRESLLDRFELTGDAGLLGLEDVERDGAGVVGFEELGSLVEQLALAGVESLPVGDVGFAQGGDLLEDRLLGLEAEILAQLDSRVVSLYGGLDSINIECALGAAGAVSLPADADEVRIDAPGTALGVRND